MSIILVIIKYFQQIVATFDCEYISICGFIHMHIYIYIYIYIVESMPL